MQWRKAVGLILVLGGVVALLYGCTELYNPLAERDTSAYPKDAAGRMRVLIGFSSRPTDTTVAKIGSLGGKVRYAYRLIPVVAAEVPGAVLPSLRGALGARYVEPDGRVQAADAELDNTWGVKRIGAGAVHAAGITGAGVRIAILDTGIDYTHPEFAGRCAGGWDFFNGDADPMDDNGHGTHVAGTAAAADDGVGVVGAAPGASLLAYKVLDANGMGGWSDVIAAIDRAVTDRAQVINMSIGGTANTSLELACQRAYDAGIVLVASAGNSGNAAGTGDSVTAPAMYPSVIAVSATDSVDTRAALSSTGSTVELAAPGVGILSTKRGGGYTTLSGTSMAAPHVAGTAALLLQSGIAGPASIRSRMDTTAEDLGASGRDPLYGYGLVNSDAACGITSPPPPPPQLSTMHVGAIVMSLVKAGKQTYAQAVVSIVDEGGLPVVNASVTGAWQGVTTGSTSGTTGTDGKAYLRSTKVASPAGKTFTLCVTGASKTGWTYNSAANTATCGTTIAK